MPFTSQFVVASGAVRTDDAWASEMATERTYYNNFEHLIIHRVFVLNSIYYMTNYIYLTNFYHLFLLFYILVSFH